MSTIIAQLKVLGIIRNNDTLSGNYLRKNLTSDLRDAIVYRTSYVATDNIIERIWHIVHDRHESVKCVQCNTITPKFQSFELGYKLFCGSSCARKHPSTTERRRSTMVERYGVEHPLQSGEIKAKVVQKWKELYGVDHPSKSEYVKSKVKNTCMERYGTSTNLQYQDTIDKRLEHFTNNKERIVEARAATMLEKYGVDTTFQMESFREDSAITMMERYGVEHPSYSPQIRTKARQTMIERYGVEYTLQSPKYRDQTRRTLLEKYGQANARNANIPKLIRTNMLRYGTPYGISSDGVRDKITTTNNTRYGFNNQRQAIVGKDTYTLLNDKDWMVNHYVTLKNPIYVIADELSIDDTTVNKFLRMHNIPIDNSSSVSYAEQQISTFIRNLGFDIQNNTRSVISKELDIYIASKKLAIEFCGLYWHCDRHQRMVPNYHLDKLQQCEAKGITLITIFEDEWIHNSQLIFSKLQHLLGHNSTVKVSARNAVVCAIDNISKDLFLDANHIQGSGPGSVSYGLTLEGKMVACMTFKCQSPGKYILNRYATSCNVRGGFSKLLAYFKNNHTWTSIITFADRRWSTGQLYINNGFELIDTLSPDYRYVIGNKRVHKFNFRRNRLPKRLKTFDPALSEVVNCRNNGLYRIWDCGLLKYEIKNAN